jgi:hypothetical protein
MKTRAVLCTAAGTLFVAGALIAATATVAHGSATRSQSNSQNFPDSQGENPAAPDITSIGVSNDDAGKLTFQVNISNRPALTPDMLLVIFLDTDSNPATGDPNLNGADYVIQLIPQGVGLFKWNGTDFAAAASQSSLVYAYGSTGATINVNASDLGKPKAFNFGVEVDSGIATDASGNPDFTNAVYDLAPDPGHGFYSYQVKTQLVLKTVAFTTAPKPAKAGRPFAVGLAVTENDTDGPVTAGTVTCSANISFKPIPALRRGSLSNGIAACAWAIPKSAKGKTIRGTITLIDQGVAVKHSFTAKIS